MRTSCIHTLIICAWMHNYTYLLWWTCILLKVMCHNCSWWSIILCYVMIVVTNILFAYFYSIELSFPVMPTSFFYVPILSVLFFLLSAKHVPAFEMRPCLWPVVLDFDSRVGSMIGHPLNLLIYILVPCFRTKAFSYLFSHFG